MISISEFSTAAGCSPASGPWPLASKPDGVDEAAIDLGHAEDLLDPVGYLTVLGEVDRPQPNERAAETFGLHVADDDDRRTQELGRRSGGETHGPRPCDVDRRAAADTGLDAAVVAGREDVGEHRQVEDLLHRLVFVGELEQIPIGVGNQHVLRLTAAPAAHVDIAVGRPGAIGLAFRQRPVSWCLQLRQRPQEMLNGVLRRGRCEQLRSHSAGFSRRSWQP